MAKATGKWREVGGGWLMEVIQMGRALPRSAFFNPYSIRKRDFMRTTT